MNSVTTTNADGSITRIVVMHQTNHYVLMAAGFIAFLVAVWLLRKVFWEKDPN
jgi:hypothetical protein